MDERSVGLIYFFNKCRDKYFKDKEYRYIPFNCSDRGNSNENAKEYSMCFDKNNMNLKKYCGPDWVFCHWPSADIHSFENTKNQIIFESNKQPTIDKVGWFGNIHSPLSDVIEYTTRPLLLKIGNENPDLFDVIHVQVPQSTVTNYLSLPDLIKYKYLIDIGGNGYSGRLKFLLFSKRPLLIVDRNFVEYFYHDLIPYTHYIPVNMDLSNLLEQVNWMKMNPEKALEIANNAFYFALNNFTEDKLIERVYHVYNNIF